MQANLGHLLAYCKPGSLYIFNVRQHNAAQGNHTYVLFGQVLNAADAGKQGVHVLEGPGNEGQEAFGSFRLAALHLAYFGKMFKPFLQGFHMAKHHGGGSGDVQFVGFVHDVQPFLGAAFSFGDQPANAVHQDFGSRAGQRVQAGLFQGRKHLVVTFFLQLANVGYFGRAQCVQLECGIKFFQAAEQVNIELKAQAGMVAALQQELVAPVTEGLFYLLPVGVNICDIGFGVTGYAVEIAKLTVCNAHVGSVHIAVYLPGDLAVRHLFQAQLVGQEHQFGQRGVFKQEHPFLHGNKLEVQGFLVHIGKMHVDCWFKPQKYAGVVHYGNFYEWCNSLADCMVFLESKQVLVSKGPFYNKRCIAMRRLWPPLLALCLLACAYAQAQEEFVPPPARFLTSFSFRQFTGGVVVLRGLVGNYPDTLNFILDTGSGGISLDSATCERLKIKSVPSDRTIRGIAGVRNVRFVYNEKLHLPGLTLDSMNFHINDYEILTSAYGEQIDGIIGYSFLSRYIVKINYDSSRIQVYSKGWMKYPRGGFLLRPILATLPIQVARLEDNRDVSSRFYFDTGAGLCLLLSAEFVGDSAVLNPRRKPVMTQGEGLGGKMEMQLTTIKEFRLGPYRFKKVPTYIFDDAYNVTAYPYLGGLIGNDILRRFNIILNYDRRDIYLVPNTHFREPFDYSYTGLGIYKIDSEVVVVDIMKGSPAEKAGFEPGDIILAVNNNFSGNVQQYKNMMQVTGEKLKILVHRETGPVLLTLKVKSILK
jgi:hypothetical protein